MTDNKFKDFQKDREQAATAYVRGDASKLDALVPHEGSASFHSPRGDTVVGAEDVAARYRADAKAFRSNGTTELEVIQQAHDSDLAFWTGFQKARVQVADAPQPVEMRIRVTEIFRRLDGDWRLVHRHADMPRG